MSAAPGVQHIGVGWERYGLQTDDEYFRERQEIEKVHFAIDELAWTREGNESKENRVERLEPDVRNGRFYLPIAVWREGKPCVWRIVRLCASGAHANKTDAKTCAECGTDQWSAYKLDYREVDGLTRLQQDALESGSGELIAKAIKRKDEEGNVYDLVERFVSEYEAFPFAQTDDLVDACSRLYDMEPTPPVISTKEMTEPKIYFDS